MPFIIHALHNGFWYVYNVHVLGVFGYLHNIYGINGISLWAAINMEIDCSEMCVMSNFSRKLKQRFIEMDMVPYAGMFQDSAARSFSNYYVPVTVDLYLYWERVVVVWQLHIIALGCPRT